MIEDVFERHVAGSDPFRIEALFRTVLMRGFTRRPDVSLMGVLSGIEMACWDIVGKAVDKPVYELLGGQVHERLRAYTYLYPEPGDTDRRLHRSRPGRRTRCRLCRAGLHGGQVRPGRTLLRLRPAPAEPRGARRARSASSARCARGRRRPLRPPVRHARPVHRLRRAPPGEAARALRPARGSRSRCRPTCPEEMATVARATSIPSPPASA